MPLCLAILTRMARQISMAAILWDSNQLCHSLLRIYHFICSSKFFIFFKILKSYQWIVETRSNNFFPLSIFKMAEMKKIASRNNSSKKLNRRQFVRLCITSEIIASAAEVAEGIKAWLKLFKGSVWSTVVGHRLLNQGFVGSNLAWYLAGVYVLLSFHLMDSEDK